MSSVNEYWSRPLHSPLGSYPDDEIRSGARGKCSMNASSLLHAMKIQCYPPCVLHFDLQRPVS